MRKKRNGDDYLKLTLADVTGRLQAVCWDEAGLPCWAAAPPTTSVGLTSPRRREAEASSSPPRIAATPRS